MPKTKTPPIPKMKSYSYHTPKPTVDSSAKAARIKPYPTTYLERFRAAVTLLCSGQEPPLDICEQWLAHEQDPYGADPLQAWAASHAGVFWATGIGTLEAAEVMANTPEEGEGHLFREKAEIAEPETLPIPASSWVNGCDTTAPAALRFLAENPRRPGGSDMFNSEHLHQLAEEIEKTAKNLK